MALTALKGDATLNELSHWRNHHGERFFIKSAQSLTTEARKQMVSQKHQLSLLKQCQVLKVARSSYYYQAKPECEENLTLMKTIDKLRPLQ